MRRALKHIRHDVMLGRGVGDTDTLGDVGVFIDHNNTK